MQSSRTSRSQTKGIKRALAVCLVGAFALAAAPPEYRLVVVHVYPHDRTAFTQGLEFHAGLLYEGTGRAGLSRLRAEKLESGDVIRQFPLAQSFFGEGITVLGQRVFQLTWLNGKGFIYDAATFRRLGEFSYPGQGWGLTNDGSVLYMSDGSNQIRVWDGSSLKELRRITVQDGDQTIDLLNELEWVRGEIWANIWHSDRIARISPADGRVTGWIDASGLLQPGEVTDPEAVLNGIAYDAATNRIFLTGKLWPKLFQVRMEPANLP
jgi:glutaminyl-peptide cyclotransferase